MAYIQATAAPRLSRSLKPSTLSARTFRDLFCYTGFALSFGFAVAVVFGLLS
jgi:hypothetical protein